jgi:tetratricopeptide (TPR) repeat protein
MAAPGTNAALAATNRPFVSTSAAPASAVSTGQLADAKGSGQDASKRPSFGTLLSYAAALFGVCVFLSLLLANDCSQFVAHRFVTLLYSDDGEDSRPPEYEKAEQASMDGQPLEAIRMMRDYYKKNPRKVYVALRIAEIYEKDLGNHLAAALEYEEILKYRLRPEQWGQTAIHLANLYSGKLGKPEKALELLRRIDADYGETAAAVKARARLSQLDGGPAERAEAPATPPEPAPAATPREEPPSNLPKGFRPKK